MNDPRPDLHLGVTVPALLPGQSLPMWAGMDCFSIDDVQDTAVISIVEDDESVRLALRSLVLSLGYKPSVFATAEEFLESEQLNTTSCLISDLQMPGLSGIELQARLNSLGCCPPMIFVTAFADAQSRERAFAGGAVGFLEKPFECGIMVRLIEEALQAGRPAD